MSKGLSRSLQTRQIYLKAFIFGVAGGVSPTITGLDKAAIKSIVRNGTGDYTITVKEIAQDNLSIMGVHCATDGLYARVSAVSKSTVRVLIKTFAGVATDGDVNLTVGWHGSKYQF
jgi:hypothetical protein